ncbi:Ger(x)C family spore germination protein [Alkalicella caledoniensis]|uniref:Ger(X)C family spore germination protein n=1 Tax=Alkalicella caledoniensis TaxID=2731377 RepID=A0A7G9W739_ALKCA|nr:Ger(x)C family spore germination protein [Alkalicella caledoniensis]QNO14501.1 Ger(x)C family spore germination protein [Alkalicella caledoniensis]
MLSQKSKIFIVIILLCLMVSGCAVQHQRIIDQLSVILGIGIDIDENNPDIYILTTTNPTFSDEAEVPVFETTTKGYGFEGALRNWEYQRQNRYALGKVSTVIFGEELLKNGIDDVVLELRQFADMNVLARPVYFPGKPQDAWAITPPEEARRAVFLMNMLERIYEEGLIPRVSLCNLNTIILDKDIDGIMPQIELTKDKNRFHITGLALLDEKARLATVLNESDMLLYLILNNDAIGAFTTTQVTIQGKRGYISFLIKSHDKTDVKVNMKNGKPEIILTAGIEIEIRSIRVRGIDGLTNEFFDEIEREISKDLTVNTQKIIDEMQRVKSDPLGLGQWVRIQQTGYYNKGTWREDYPNADIKCKIDVEVSRVNVIKEKPE